MAGEEKIEGEIEVETLYLAETINNIAGGLHAIADAINRLADATAGEEIGDPEGEDVGYLDGKR